MKNLQTLKGKWKSNKIRKLEKQVINLERINDDKEIQVKKIKCPQCNFEAVSHQGLKVHMKRKHTKVDSTYPINCHICEKELKTSNDMKRHLKTHSYKNANYKCEECDFVGRRKETMDVHVGQAHSENYECGLCEFKASDA